MTLNDKNNSTILSVALELALQFVSASRAMLFHFPAMDHHNTTSFATFAFDSLSPFVLVRLVRGPNFRRVQLLQDVNQLVPVDNVTFVIGFAEERGRQWHYEDREVLELVAMMKHPKFRGLSLGVFLSAEFLSQFGGVLQFRPLMELPNFKYLFVRAGLIMPNNWSPSASQVRNLKYTIRLLGRETFIHTEWRLRWSLYTWESIDDPQPPITAAPTAGTGATATTTNTTTTTTEEPPSIADVTLTSESTPTTTSFFLNYTRVTFPTVKDTSGATRCHARGYWDRQSLALAVVGYGIISLATNNYIFQHEEL